MAKEINVDEIKKMFAQIAVKKETKKVKERNPIVVFADKIRAERDKVAALDFRSHKPTAGDWVKKVDDGFEFKIGRPPIEIGTEETGFEKKFSRKTKQEVLQYMDLAIQLVLNDEFTQRQILDREDARIAKRKERAATK